MKCIPLFAVIIGLFAIISAQRIRNSNNRRDGFNFSDLIPSDQINNRKSYSARRRDSPDETSPALARFSDIIPARQIEGDVETAPRPQIVNNINDILMN